MKDNTAITTCVCVFFTVVGTCILTAILQPSTPASCLDQQRYFVALCSEKFQGDTVLKCLEKTPTCEKENDKHSSEDVLQGREAQKYGATP